MNKQHDDFNHPTDRPAGVAETNVPLVAPKLPTSKYEGRYDLAPFSNALNNVLNLRNTPDKDAIIAEFEAQLVYILEASVVAPDAFNKLVTHDTQTPGQTFEGHPK